MRICAISDLHGNLITNIEPCELLLICGDIMPLYMQRNKPQCESWLLNEFSTWIKELPCEKVIFIAGNHDFVFENRDFLWINRFVKFPTEGKAAYLENSFFDYLSNEGKIYRIFGTPACKIFGNWAFMYDSDTLMKKYLEMPNNCDIVISHDAPDLNNCGLIPPGRYNQVPVNAGNPWLADVIKDTKPRYAFCGHIHEGNHWLEDAGDTKTANVSILDDSYSITYEPLYCDI